MINIPTGRTINHVFTSVDSYNLPVSAATFDVFAIRNGSVFDSITPEITPVNESIGLFSVSWSAHTEGDYQIYIKNNDTTAIFISPLVMVRPDSEFETNVFIGL